MNEVEQYEPPRESRTVDMEIGEVLNQENIPSWEEAVSEWTEGAAQALEGQLRQARAANAVNRHYGQSSMEDFAKEVGASKSTVYDYSRVWSIYGHLFETGYFSGRLESGGLSMSHFIESSHAPDPVATLDDAEDEGKSSRQIKAERQEAGKPGNVEMVDLGTCPECGSVFKLRDADIRSEQAAVK